ncbi:hypothetical protein GOODEAATRI_023253 [Goodea atripinnis]|uniref:Bromo domain-containing protein n=1 Tax=Goodea atripinnis TaxID=208336 RepID=A0ABV0PR13_9TELE
MVPFTTRSSRHSPQTLLMLYRRTAGTTFTAGCATARARCSAVSSAPGSYSEDTAATLTLFQDHPRLSSRSPHAASSQRKTFNWTEPFQKPVSLEQHPDYAEYIFHPMDLCTLEKNIKKKMYGCTEAFLADVKWILHNCIIYNGGNHKLTATAKVIVKICEHEINEIEVCPECYLSTCQKRENWFCEPCVSQLSYLMFYDSILLLIHSEKNI